MNLIVFGMRHPITTMMMIVALIAGGGLALSRMRVDIFPPINQPQIYRLLQLTAAWTPARWKACWSISSKWRFSMSTA